MINTNGRAFALFAGLSLALHPLPLLAAPAKPASAPGQCKMKTASGLGYSILKAGKGAAPLDTDKVTVKYRGTLANGGAEFDKSDSATFPLGGVIPGFSEGLKLTRVGGRSLICIPAALGYADRATGPIPPNSDLVFDVELLEIKQPTAPLAANARTCATKLPSGVSYTTVKPGAGGSPGDADAVLVNYKGYLAATGAVFDEGDRIPFPVNGVIPGFSEGIKQMQKGGTTKICIPAAQGYGATENGPIPANSDLVFDVELVDYRSLSQTPGSDAPASPQ